MHASCHARVLLCECWLTCGVHGVVGLFACLVSRLLVFMFVFGVTFACLCLRLRLHLCLCLSLQEDTVHAVAEQGAKVAWVGYGDEGMTVEQWLTRVGCHGTLVTFREVYVTCCALAGYVAGCVAGWRPRVVFGFGLVAGGRMVR